jgi:hypothetical protein
MLELSAEPEVRGREAVPNVAGSETFSSDRSVADHAGGLRKAAPRARDTQLER